MAITGDQRAPSTTTGAVILTPDQRVRVFVSSTLEELAAERAAVRDAVERMRLSPILFEFGARPHPPRSLYRSYLEQSHVFIGIYWERYGWIAPSMEVSGLEDEYLLARSKPKLMYVKRPAPGREPQLEALLDRIRSGDDVSYKPFSDAAELKGLVADDLSLLLSEAFLVDPAPGESSRHRFTLPGELTSFVGRDDELEQLGRLLERPDTRLVTLTGPGGIGKTRLALRAAAEAAPSFEEGAAFVSLAPLKDHRSVVSAVAAAVGLRDYSGIALETLAADLADRSLLLVLDNFEHVIAAAGMLTTLLEGAPDLVIMVTSREALRIQPEHEFPVPPLNGTDRTAMFSERAAAVRPDFVVDDSVRDDVERIGACLEGVPLAIELAAARVKLLTPAAILERLDHRLDFLVGGSRDLPDRQRALRSTIEWSYALLNDADRRVFAALGVFVGSFSLSAVQAVLPALEFGDVDALDLLGSLVDKSLVRVEATADEPRFRMLEMIAAFARDRLAESDDAELVGELHAAHYHEVGTAVGRGVVMGDQAHWLNVLGDDTDGEAGNLRAALGWLIAHGRLDSVADLAWALWIPAWIKGRVDEGRHLVRSALEVDAPMTGRSRGRLLVVMGLFDVWSGEHEHAAVVLGEGGALARAVGDQDAAVGAVLAESMIAGPIHGEARAEELAHEALDSYRRMGDAWGEAAALNVLGWLYVAQERFDSGEVFEQALAASLAAGDEQFSALAEVDLAEYLLHHGDVDAATELLESCCTRHRSLRLMYSAAYLLEAVARLALLAGDAARATRLAGAACQIRDSTGVSIWGSQLDRRDRFLALLRAELGPADYDRAFAAGFRLCYADALDEMSLGS